MDPNAPSHEEPIDIQSHLEDRVDPELIFKHLEAYFPQLAAKIEESQVERWPRIMILDDGTLSREYLSHIRDVAIDRNIDVIMPDRPILDEVAELRESSQSERMSRRTVLVGGGTASIAKVLLDILSKMPMIEPLPEPEVECFIVEEGLEVVRQPPPKKGKQTFQQFQNARHNHGPSTRRQFAQIRPPRRGGRR
jgi:hypothetical protein